jgi:valyl-tRNA synthetase
VLPHLEAGEEVDPRSVRGGAAGAAGAGAQLPDRWILSRLEATAADVNRNLEAFRFDQAAGAIYEFFWSELCDWYLEMAKPVLAENRAGAAAARGVLRRCLQDSLALLHPFMPFLTEEIWEKLTDRPGTLVVSPYPRGDESARDAAAEEAMGAFRAIVTRVRNLRTERGLSPTAPLPLTIEPSSPRRALVPVLEELGPMLRHLGRLSSLDFGAAPDGSFRDVIEGVAIAVALPERPAGSDAKIEKALAEVSDEIASLSAKLQNPAYLEKAPAPVVEKARLRLRELEEKRAALATP